ncbi:MAG: hypothetical protein QM751_08650 [Paludibacteraceae bacterium]
MYRNYINDDFLEYLNRYLTGITLLKDEIAKIRLSYYLSEAYSNYACRIMIEVDLLDDENLTKEKKVLVNQYLYNSYSDTGSQFVSFIYKAQRSHDIDAQVIKAFISCYEFAQSLLNNFVKNIVPEECAIEIKSLESEPFFNYIVAFLTHYDYDEKTRSFSCRYFELNHRDFEFDCYYHDTLVKNANPEPIAEETVTDRELFNASCGDIEDIRRMVVNNKIPYTFQTYSNVIDEISIHMPELKRKMEHYIPENSFEKIYPKAIFRLIEKKEKEKSEKQKLLMRKSAEMGIEPGDYILVEDSWNNYKEYIGLVKEIRLRGVSLEIEYAILKNDLSESRLPRKRTEPQNVKRILKSGIQNTDNLETKLQLENMLNKQGVKNKLFKQGKSKK